MTSTTLGIDLGGCMSGNSAYAVVQWDNSKAKVIELIKEPKHSDHIRCAGFLRSILCKYPVDSIAVDAPFSLPKKLIDPNFISIPREAKGEIANPYLYRYTDYWLYKQYGLRVMPPAGDRIGRLTARMIEILDHFDYDGTHLNINETRLPVYEVYPKQIALALGYTDYKKHSMQLLRQFSLKDIGDEHLLDALLCSYCAHEIIHDNTIPPPIEAQGEGWCYPLVLN